ncbi:MAG: acyl-CoA thioesterase [Candidatus Omnitrophica bacterium]|nr:acyl-CoA thioesterase [Candidatus Omnitrophota bacterium]
MYVHETHIRVRYQETDNMGVVYYANYFVWFEIARSEYFRSMGISYREMENRGLFMMVVGASCAYKAPSRYDDVVKIQAWVPEVKNTSIKFGYKLFVGDKLIATGESAHVFTDKSRRPVRIPQEIRNIR